MENAKGKPARAARGGTRRARSIALTIAAAWVVVLSWAGCRQEREGAIVEVRAFGSNPGELKMFTYVPRGLTARAPLVVALHGCLQNARLYGENTGWTAMADRYGFALLLPEQQPANNVGKCFNWFLSEDNERDTGEALSIKQMIDTMKADHAIDASRIYVTGLSAGGAMTVVMLAAYPEQFAGGAIIAGVPYKCANGAAEARASMKSARDLEPGQWGDKVRAATPYSGPRPRLVIWHGRSDSVVDPANMRELVEQWTNLHGIDQTAEAVDTVNGHEHAVYQDGQGKTRIETYLVDTNPMDTVVYKGHGTPIDPQRHCGAQGPYLLSAGICSAYYSAQAWGLAPVAEEPVAVPAERGHHER